MLNIVRTEKATRVKKRKVKTGASENTKYKALRGLHRRNTCLLEESRKCVKRLLFVVFVLINQWAFSGSGKFQLMILCGAFTISVFRAKLTDLENFSLWTKFVNIGRFKLNEEARDWLNTPIQSLPEWQPTQHRLIFSLFNARIVRNPSKITLPFYTQSLISSCSRKSFLIVVDDILILYQRVLSLYSFISKPQN